MKMEKAPEADLKMRMERLAGELAKTRWVLVGTIRPRRIASRNSRQKELLGPYYQWTFKEAGKTVTVNLSAAQAGAFQKAIDANRKAEETLAEMRVLSRQYLEAAIPGVKRRKPKQE